MHDFFLERDYPPADTLSRIATRLGHDTVHADDLRIALKLDMETFAPALDKLLAQGAAEMDMAGNVTAVGTQRQGWRGGYEAQVNFRRGQIDAMMRFASGAECRMAALIRHFGDHSDSSRNCGLCDFCAPNGAVAQPFRDATGGEEREMRRVLRELSNASARSTGKLYTELFPKNQMDRKEFDGLLDALSRGGYLAMESATFTNPEGRDIPYRKATITHEGREVEQGASLVGVQLRDVEMANAGRSSRERASTSSGSRAKRLATQQSEEEMQPLSATQKTAEAALRAWRRDTAAELKQPAFCVFSDRVLRSIAREGPGTEADLLEISGLGNAKVERWGAAICALLQGGAAASGEVARPAPSTPRATMEQRRMAHSPEAGRARKNAAPTLELVPPLALSPSTPQAEPTEQAASLEQTLKVWRMREAARLKLAPFVLLLDSTIRGITESLPESVAALEHIKGVSKPFAAQHGEAICALIRLYSAENMRPIASRGVVLQ